MSKRTLDSFFHTASSKRVKVNDLKPPINIDDGCAADDHPASPPTNHFTYPFPVPLLPPSIFTPLQYSPANSARYMNNRPHLDLLYFEPFIDRRSANALFRFLRRELFFYRVKYTIKRGLIETQINTPRYTTVFGIDESSIWEQIPDQILDAATKRPVDAKKYSCQPRPIPECLTSLQRATEAVTGERFNFCLVNYYADGNDSISYHSDDERFLGPDPAIASFSLGSGRDFLMKPKPDAANPAIPSMKGKSDDVLKLSLQSGDMVLMRGETQGKWLHSIPKRKGGQGEGGRINITFRKALVKGGTENYYRYNVGNGEVYRWDDSLKKMTESDTKNTQDR